MEYTLTNEEAIDEGRQEVGTQPLFAQPLPEFFPTEVVDRSLELAGSDLLLGC